MKYLPNIAGAFLGLAFFSFAFNYFFPFMNVGGAKPGSPAALFFTAVVPTGFMAFVKICEIIGAILVAMPSKRNFGLLILGPIVINILAFNIFIAGRGAVFKAPVIGVSILTAYLLWCGRDRFLGLYEP